MRIVRLGYRQKATHQLLRGLGEPRDVLELLLALLHHVHDLLPLHLLGQWGGGWMDESSSFGLEVSVCVLGLINDDGQARKEARPASITTTSRQVEDQPPTQPPTHNTKKNKIYQPTNLSINQPTHKPTQPQPPPFPPPHLLHPTHLVELLLALLPEDRGVARHLLLRLAHVRRDLVVAQAAVLGRGLGWLMGWGGKGC